MGVDTSDDCIVLGGAKPTCSVWLDSSSSIRISGSTMWPRDPAAYADKPIRQLLRQLLGTPYTPPPDSAWCSHCGDWRLKSYFSPDTSRKSGVDRYCKQCRAELKRRRYAEQVGRPVRAYARQGA